MGTAMTDSPDPLHPQGVSETPMPQGPARVSAVLIVVVLSLACFDTLRSAESVPNKQPVSPEKTQIPRSWTAGLFARKRTQKWPPIELTAGTTRVTG